MATPHDIVPSARETDSGRSLGGCMQDAQMGKAAEAKAPPRQLRFGEAAYNDAAHFLTEEAHLLDNGHFEPWLDLLADDIQVTMAVRQTVRRIRGDGRGTMYWLYDDKDAIRFKAMRYLGDSAWEDDPPSRYRRMISNIRVCETCVAGEYQVESYLLLQRSTGDQHNLSSFSACRNDILRSTGCGMALARRNILVDQAVIGMPNLGFML